MKDFYPMPGWAMTVLSCAAGLLFLLFSPMLFIRMVKAPKERPSVAMLKKMKSQVIVDLQHVTDCSPIDMDKYNELKDLEQWIVAKLAVLTRPTERS